MDFPDLGNSLRASNGGHAPFVPVPEGLAGFVRYPAFNFLAHVLPHLDSHWSNARDGRSVLLEMCEIADDEHFRMAFNIQSIVDEHASASVHLCAESAAQRRCCYACCPKGNGRIDLLLADVHGTGLDVSVTCAGRRFDAEWIKMSLRV